MANEAGQAAGVPSFVELEAAGALIGEIRIDAQDIFDLEDPKENRLFYRLANKLHIKTRPGVIEHSLLFKSGEPVSARLIEESERLMHGYSFLYDIVIRPIAYHDGIVDIEVTTRDTWSLLPILKFSRAGGVNTKGITIDEANLLGTGSSLSIRSISDIDRKGTEVEIGDQHAFGSLYTTNYRYARLSDGKRQSISLAQPFYALDTRWSAGFSMSQDEHVDSIYAGGVTTGQYSHAQRAIELFGGWSKGLVDGWVRRHTVGLLHERDIYGYVATGFPSAPVPPDQRLTAPFFRYEIIEDNSRKLKNRDQIERPEYVAMGFQSSVQIGRALDSLGSSDKNIWPYKVSINDGFEISPGSDLLMAASLAGKYDSSIGEKHLLKGSARYYMPRSEHTLLFVSIEGNAVRNPGLGEQIMVGGDNGLRGYPLRYQSGNKSVMVNVERRAYTDWYPFRLFRVGGAIFYDVGRAWGGGITQNTTNPGWLNDIGFGLRFLSARTAHGNVTHADLAFPLNRDTNTRSFQFLFKTTTSF